MYDRDFGRAADVGFGIFVDNCFHRHLEFMCNIENVSRVEQNRVLMLAALAAFSAFEPKFTIQVHQLPLDVFCAALFR